MSGELTESQKNLDSAITQAMDQYNQLDETLRKSPVGAAARDAIAGMFGKRNGPGAAQLFHEAFDDGHRTYPGFLSAVDGAFPNRIDGGSANPPNKETPQSEGNPQSPPGEVNDAAYSAEPGDGRKWMPRDGSLPMKVGPADRASLDSADQSVEQINDRLFHVDPNLAWKPGGAELPNTGTNISTLGGAYDLAHSAMPKLQAAVARLDRAFGSGGSGEQLIDDEYERMRGPINAITSSVQGSQSVPGIIGRSGTAANDEFHALLRGSNLAARTEIGRGVQKIVAVVKAGQPTGWRKALAHQQTHGEFTGVPGKVNGPRATPLADESGRLKTLGSAMVAPGKVDYQKVGVSDAPADRPGDKKGAPSGGHGGGGGGAPKGGVPGGSKGSVPGGSRESTVGGKSGSKDNDLSKLLGQLGQQAGQIPQQAGQAGQQAGQIPQQAAQAGQQAANDAQRVPESLLKALNGEKGTPKSNADRAAGLAGADREAATTATFTHPGKASPESLGKPGTDARPHQLDADGKPVDKDGDGKVDKDAKPLSKKAVKPFDMSVKSRDETASVRGVPDPRIGEMLQNMADGTEDKPVSVLDAARAAGMNIESLGDPIEPADAKVGNAVIGDEKSGMYLGDGRVLTSTGDIESLEDVTGEDGFVSDIPLPDLPDDAQPSGPDGGAPAHTVASHEPDGPAVTEAEAPAGPPASGDVPAGPPPVGGPAEMGGDAPAGPPPPADGPPAAPPPSAPDGPLPAAVPAGAPAAPPAAEAGTGPLPRQVPYQRDELG